MMDRPVVLWFRQDLRLSDHPALEAAFQTGQPILPLFILEEESRRPLGQASRWWLHHSLTALQKKLPNLCLRRGSPKIILSDLLRQSKATHIFWNRRYDPEGIKTDTFLKKQFTEMGIEVNSFKGNLLHEPWTILTSSGQPYQVFTPYWKKCLNTPPADHPLKEPSDIPVFSADSENLKDWNLLPCNPDWAAGFSDLWIPGEDSAQRRLADFIDFALAEYTEHRNLPGEEGTSGLSPHLHWGEITPLQIWHAVQAHQTCHPSGQKNISAYLSEIGWREFSHALLYHFPDLSETPLKTAFQSFPWRNDSNDLIAWKKGRTGYPIVDAGMRQLWHTGWMHNRVRMIVASFLTKHLLISWQTGEKWFWDTLVDADMANNAASWQWVAGCGADAAPYFRIFNPVLQGEKFDPLGTYIRKWVPELQPLPNAYIHKPWLAPLTILQNSRIQLGTTYPYPIVDHAMARTRALQAYKRISFGSKV